MINPVIKIREAYWNLLNASLTVPTFVDNIPIGTNPIPNVYVLISEQSKKERRLCKNCPQNWSVTVTLDIIGVNEFQSNNRLKIDEVEQSIINLVNNCGVLVIEGFGIEKTIIQNSINADIELPNQSMDRQILTIEHHVYEK